MCFFINNIKLRHHCTTPRTHNKACHINTTHLSVALPALENNNQDKDGLCSTKQTQLTHLQTYSMSVHLNPLSTLPLSLSFPQPSHAPLYFTGAPIIPVVPYTDCSNALNLEKNNRSKRDYIVSCVATVRLDHINVEMCVEEIVNPKMSIMPSFTHPALVPNLFEFLSQEIYGKTNLTFWDVYGCQ